MDIAITIPERRECLAATHARIEFIRLYVREPLRTRETECDYAKSVVDVDND
jgi:hypothetical protein